MEMDFEKPIARHRHVVIGPSIWSEDIYEKYWRKMYEEMQIKGEKNIRKL